MGRVLAAALTALGLLFAAGALLADGSRPAVQPGGNTYAFEDIPVEFGFPADENALLSYVYQQDRRAMREHAWNLWAGLNAPSRSVWNGQVLPIWETWYADTEVFEDRYLAEQASVQGRTLRRPFSPPRQTTHTDFAPGTPSGAVMSFVKYNQAAATHTWDQRYYLRSTLMALRERFDALDTPAQERQIAPFPRNAATLKIVYWLIKRPDSLQSENGLTPLPYWDPNYPPPPDGRPPMHLTWTKCVAVDPGGMYPLGSRQRVNCNGTAAEPRYVEAEVIGPERFFSYRLSDQADVDAANRFLRQKSGGADEQERLVASLEATAEAGDWVALMAMHVTTKELDDWTFQTYWWSPTPDAAPHGDYRPASVRGVWAQFQMCTAYSMDTPRTPEGGPHICFNPYLEADLGPTEPITVGGQTYPPDPMAGTRSNCQSCHARAGLPAFVKDDPTSANYGRVFNEGYIAPNDSYYARLVKTDLLWSLVFLSQPRGPGPTPTPTAR
jgi:hypothetical protein